MLTELIEWLNFNIRKVLYDIYGSWEVCFSEEFTFILTEF